jgi:predicted small metal-binding protein
VAGGSRLRVDDVGRPSLYGQRCLGMVGAGAVLAPCTTAREDRSGLTWRLAMALRIICMCGYVIQGDDDDELWRNAQGHMGVLHPELVGNVTREDILAQAEQL